MPCRNAVAAAAARLDPGLRAHARDMQLLHAERRTEERIEERPRYSIHVVLARSSPCRDDRALGFARFNPHDGRGERGGAVIAVANLVAQIRARRRCGDHARQRSAVHQVMGGEHDGRDARHAPASLVDRAPHGAEDQFRNVACFVAPAHYCPVKWAAPSLRSSIGAGCRLNLFGADLNFDFQELRSFPGADIPEECV